MNIAFRALRELDTGLIVHIEGSKLVLKGSLLQVYINKLHNKIKK